LTADLIKVIPDKEYTVRTMICRING
jgi:hypothetical protein